MISRGIKVKLLAKKMSALSILALALSACSHFNQRSISSDDEVILPGLGVLFEIVWQNCSEDVKNNILQTLVNNI